MARSDDLEVAARYGAEHPDDFGGLYLDQGTPVVLFTRSLNRHAAALRAIVTRPDQLRVESADHGWLEMLAMNEIDPAIGVQCLSTPLDTRATVKKD